VKEGPIFFLHYRVDLIRSDNECSRYNAEFICSVMALYIFSESDITGSYVSIIQHTGHNSIFTLYENRRPGVCQQWSKHDVWI